jgi:peptide/nickel transport system permease protein
VTRRRFLAWVSLGYLALMIVVALGRSVVAGEGRFALVPYHPDEINLGERLQAPSSVHLLGTDDLGRDVLARMVHGAAVSLAVGLTAAGIALVVGSLFGAVAGYYGGAADWIVSRLIELVLCFPFLFLVLAIVAFFPQSTLTIILALGLTSWTTEARLIRAEFLRLRDQDFSVAARASGAGDSRIIVRHLLPNAIAPVVALASFGVGSAVLMESALSFIGLGVPLPQASWGSILSTADDYLGHAWWLAVFPGLAIFLTVAACNIVGDAIRDVLDPRTISR